MRTAPIEAYAVVIIGDPDFEKNPIGICRLLNSDHQPNAIFTNLRDAQAVRDEVIEHRKKNGKKQYALAVVPVTIVFH